MASYIKEVMAMVMESHQKRNENYLANSFLNLNLDFLKLFSAILVMGDRLIIRPIRLYLK